MKKKDVFTRVAPLKAGADGQDLPQSGSGEKSPLCRVCGGYGFIAQKQHIDDGWGEVDTCPACEPRQP